MEQTPHPELREQERFSFKPCVVVLYGPTMSGKTTAAERLASVSNFATYDADTVKRELFANVPEPKSSEVAFYSAENTKRTNEAYTELVNRAIENFRQGIPTALSGTFSFDSFKEPLIRALSEKQIPADRVRIVLLAIPNDAEVANRIRLRKGEHATAAEIAAGVADYRERAGLITSWPEGVEVRTLNSEGGAEKVLQKIIEDLKDLEE